MLRNLEANRGFTIIELLISLVAGLVVLTASMSFAVTTMRSVGANEIREDVQRNARFVAMSLQRDVQSTGVGIESLPWFGALTVRGDTMVILSVPYDPNEAPIHDLEPPAGVNNPLSSGGTCGTRCLTLKKVDGTHAFAPGDLARLQVNGQRRLIVVESVADAGANFLLTFTNEAEIFGYTAGLKGGLLLDRFGTSVQELSHATYYVEDGHLMRSDQFDSGGELIGAVLADGIQSWEVTLVFVDGDEAEKADPFDLDDTNDYDDIVSVRILATLAADDPDPRLNQGLLYTRDYEWMFAPRNLTYERNR